MANRDFEIDLRMKADFASAQRELKRTQDDIRKIGEATAAANAEMASLGKTKTSGGTGGSAEIEAQTAALGRNLQARQSIATASSLTQRAVSAEIGLIRELHERLERGARSFDDLADTEARLDAAMGKGLITAEEYDEALDKLNDEQARLTRENEKSGKALDTTIGRYDKASAGLQRLQQDEARLKQAVDSGRISREQYNRAMAGIGSERARLIALRDGANQAANGMRTLSLQSQEAQRNLTQMVTYAATGQWQAAGSQILQMGNSASVAGRLFTGAGLAIGATAAVIGTLVVAAVQGYLQMRAFENAIIATGNSAGVTAGQLAGMRDRIGEGVGKFGEAQEALAALVGSGKLTGDALESAAAAAVNLSTLTGKSIEDTTRQIIDLAKAPTETLLTLNEQYRFLTQEVYDNVRSLEAQGRAQDAARAATEALAKVTDERVEQMLAKAGLLEKAWHYIGVAIDAAMQAARDFGRNDAEYQQRRAQERMAAADTERRRFLAAGLSAESDQVRFATKGYLEAAEDYKQASIRLGKEQAAAQKGRPTTVDSTAIRDRKKAQEEFDQLAISNLSKKEQLEREIARIREVGVKAGKSQADIEAQIAQARARYKESLPKGPKAPKSEGQKDQEAAARELDNLQKQVALLGDLEEGETKASEAARIRYEIEDGAYKNSSDAIKAQLIDQAQLLDHERSKVEITKELKSVDLKTLELQGKGASAAVAEAIENLEKLKLKMLNAGSDDAGVAKIDNLIDLTNAKAQLEDLEQTWQRVMGEIGREQQRIQTEQQAGLITEYDAQQRIVDLYREKGVVLGQLLPQMEALAQRLGDPQAIENVRAIRAEFEQMQATTSLLQQQIGSTFQGAFSSALESLITRTASLGEAVRGFLSDMASGLARMAAAALAQAAWAKIVAVFSKGDGAGVGSGADKLQRAAVVTAGGGLAVRLGANALSTSAQELMSAATMLLVANSASGFSGGGSVSAATGGHIRGPGTSTSDSIRAWLSDGEFVTRAAVVAQPGALNFLSDFNRYGMSTLGSWGNRYASAGTPSGLPSVPRFQFADGGLAQASGAPGAANRLSVYMLLDTDQLADVLMRHPRVEKGVVAIAGKNGASIQAEW